ncbi:MULTISPECIES: hypothetical protein [unclassified Serratia (in: enterobacteria)]|uniref:hypothetical protein n=1 Tax=unclassified Serratia (in: enterobacteria) TaxID=2647522 RepID=UPI0030766877
MENLFSKLFDWIFGVFILMLLISFFMNPDLNDVRWSSEPFAILGFIIEFGLLLLAGKIIKLVFTQIGRMLDITFNQVSKKLLRKIPRIMGLV